MPQQPRSVNGFTIYPAPSVAKTRSLTQTRISSLPARLRRTLLLERGQQKNSVRLKPPRFRRHIERIDAQGWFAGAASLHQCLGTSHVGYRGKGGGADRAEGAVERGLARARRAGYCGGG